MKENEIRPAMGMDYPTIDPKTVRSEKSDYDRNCEKLSDSLCQVFNYNVWLEGKEKFAFEALLVVFCVEFRFLHIMKYLHELSEWRMGRLLNMRHSFFMELLHKVAKRMQTLTDFVHRSHRLLRDMLTDGDKLKEERTKLKEDFSKETEWLYAMTANGEVRKLANKMFKAQELHYNPAMFVTRGDSFGDHAVAVMNGLVVLSLQDSKNKTNEEYEAMFDKSYADFLSSDYWRNKLSEWDMEIESECDIYVREGFGTRLEFLKGIWNSAYRSEDELLRKFGLQHVSVTNGNGKALMSRRPFEALNRKVPANDDDPLQMTDADLREFFLYLAERQHVSELIKKPQGPENEATSTNEETKAMTEKTDSQDNTKHKESEKKMFMYHEADVQKLSPMMEDANATCLDNKHLMVEGSVAWKDYHAAVCLSFSLWDSNNADSALFAGFSRAFYKSFDKKVFTTLCSYEQFRKTQNKLYNANFKNIIAIKNATEVSEQKIGHGTMRMWYQFYHRLLPAFEKHLPRRSTADKKNGHIKLG